jgi:pyrophosphatase PpaX
LPGDKAASGKAAHIDTVLFDLDDTLLNSYDARVGALQIVFTRANITDFTAAEYLASLGGAPFREALGQLVTTRGLKNDLFTEYRRVYWKKRPAKIRLYRGVRSVLDTLRSGGCKLGIVSSKFRDYAFEGGRIGCKYELEAVNAINAFAAVIGLEDVTSPKPHPEGILLALNRLESQPENTLFVGDSPADITAANNAGCWSCLATWGVPDNGLTAKALQSHFQADSPRALLSLACFNPGL